MSAVLTGARTQIENVVRRADDFGIVLHNEHGVSDIPQPKQDLNERWASRG